MKWLVLPLLLLAAAACERCSCAPEVTPPTPFITAMADDEASIRLTVDAARATPGGTGAWVTVAAHGPTDAWLRGATLVVGLTERQVGRTNATLEGSSCALRYLHDGRLTTADYQLVEATGEVRDAGAKSFAIRLAVACRRRVDVTTGGRAHAAELPENVRFDLDLVTSWP